ncbi:uncharacterized protein MELLADRAFT_95966 [Melampsora larici-populina 98AG31]|uniref:Uncharacterized protein n=1 Tax=Melampsora larici-populina (strain 98AG31 / pathotype 3-4-7) TaxID=747676 RepID=F4RDX2_MELLP|nr:uncharacterized protein MELLADRAFT_95966 [Melampsora larici-populina 98AG31]EGG09534.1 hypothetical protein MELLADRAFT_95966 [Melampsora larici-populina 98AG31]
MLEPVHIEHGHAKWLANIREAFERDIGQYRVFWEEYQHWCQNEDTEPRDIGMINYTYRVKTATEPVQPETVKEKSKSKIETNTKMTLGSLPSNNMPGLSQYFHDIMLNKNIHMPVSIFDPTWIIQDSIFMKSRSLKTSCSTNIISYVGLPYVNEHRLTPMQWSTRYDLMVKYQEEKYDVLDSQKDSPIAPRLKVHKENVLAIQAKCYGKWTPAMRYDIAHRRNVWENRLPDGSMADVGMLNEELADRAKEDAKHFNDYKYIDNPYAFGNVMQHISPINGETYPENASWDSNTALIDTQADMLTGRSLSSITNQPVSQPLARMSASGKVGGNGFKGRHYNPAFDRTSPLYDRNATHPAPYYNPNHYTNPSPTIYQNDFYQNTRGGRGGGRGSAQRGGRGWTAGRGGGTCPAIGPGSHDKSMANKGGEKSVEGAASGST